MSKFFTKRSSKGFTLIELLVVIAIIGILSSVVIANLNTARTKARDTRRIEDVKQIQIALELYYDANSAYPTALTQLVGATGGASLSVLPKDPDTTAYAYAYYPTSGSPTSYHVGANLEQSATQTTLLNGDRDLDSTTGTVFTGGFKGADTGTCAATQATTEFCYDVSNI